MNSNHQNIKIINGEHYKIVFGKVLNLLIENLSKDLKPLFLNSITISIINTKYTNDSFLNYQAKELKNIKQIISEKSGIDIMKLTAKEYDISIFYQSNGRGTIHCSENTQKKIDKLYSFCFSSIDCLILEFLSLFINSFNRTAGDSISNIIVFEECLKLLNFSLLDVVNLVTEYPFEFDYIKVDNISEFECDEQDVKIIRPENIGNHIDDFLLNLDNKAKCYFKLNKNKKRVRLYVESICKETLKQITKKIRSFIEGTNSKE